MVANLDEGLGKCNSNKSDGSSLSEPNSIASSSGSSSSTALFSKSSPSSEMIPSSLVCLIKFSAFMITVVRLIARY